MQQDQPGTSNDAQSIIILNQEDMAAEYAADLGDVRRNRRATKLGVALWQCPDRSIPELGSEADREAAYRLLNSDEVKGATSNNSIATDADASPWAALLLLEKPLVFLRRSALPTWRLVALADDLFSLVP